MKFLFDLFPILLFFAAFKLFDIYTATAVAIAASLLQIGWLKWKRRKVDTMMWISLGIITVFGGATLALHDETFIKWKPTVLYWLFAVVMSEAEVLFRRNLIRTMLTDQVQMPDDAWTRLNWSWVAFFVFMGAANLYVAYNFSTDAWVNFKLFGGMGLMLIFVLVQGLFLVRYMEEKKGIVADASSDPAQLATRMDLNASIREKLAPLQPLRLELVDESGLHAGHPGAAGGGSHFRLAIASPHFHGKSVQERHRMVYAALGTLMGSRIHALAIRAMTPDEL